MNMLRLKLMVTLLLLSLALLPQAAMAKTAVAAPTVAEAAAGIAFRIAYARDTQTYEVYMTPATSPTEAPLTLTAQVTIKVAHSEVSPFTVANLTSAVTGTQWTLSSRVNTPNEGSNADYLSFTVDFPEGNYGAFNWVGGQEVKVFQFQNSAACVGAVTLMENSDAFAQLPNSMSTNPGNQIDVLYLGEGNLFSGSSGVADCTDSRAGDNVYFLPIVIH